MPPMFATAAVFQVPMAWLKAMAPENMSRMVVTAAVVQVPMAWLKAVAPLNMLAMFVTLDVSAQLSGLAPVFPVSPLLKRVAPANLANERSA